MRDGDEITSEYLFDGYFVFPRILRRVSRAFHTSPMPPAPRGERTS